MTGHYVAAQELFGIYRVKLLVGPFKTVRAAARMIDPVRAVWAVYDPARYNITVHTVTGRKLRAGSLDLSLIDPAHVIEAGRVK